MNTPPLQRRLSTTESARLQRLLLWLHREDIERQASELVADQFRRVREGFASASLEGSDVSDFDQLAVLELVRRGAPDDVCADLLIRDATTPLKPSVA